MAEKEPDTMELVHDQFKRSKLTLHDLGVKMGFAPEIARQSAFQFLKGSDPRLSSLKRFARAMEIPMFDLIPSHIVTCKKCGVTTDWYGGRTVPLPQEGTMTALAARCPNCGIKVYVDLVRKKK